MLCRICAVQIQPREHVLDHADYAGPTRQHELDHTDHTDHTDQGSIFPERARSYRSWCGNRWHVPYVEPYKNIHEDERRKSTFGPCSTVCPFGFRLRTFEIRRIARQADHSRDHQGCANKYIFSSFSLSATVKSSKFKVVKGIITYSQIIYC